MTGKKSPYSSNTKHEYTEIPPKDEDEEFALLGAILNNPTRLFDVRALMDTGDVFYNTQHQDIYLAMLAISDKNETIRPLSLIRELRQQGKEEILRDKSIDQMTRKGFEVGLEVLNTARYLRELYIKRLSIKNAQEVIQMAYANVDVSTIIDKSRALADMTSSKMNIVSQKSMAQIVSTILGDIEKASRITTGIVGVTTGFGKIDRITGGFQKEELVVLAGRPGMMKTGVGLFHVYSSALAGKPALWVSGEMAPENNVLRLIAAECGIAYSELRRGRHKNGMPFSTQEWEMIHAAAGTIEKLPLHFHTEPGPDVGDMTYLALDLQQRYGIEEVGFDYIQIMTDRTAGRSDFEQSTSVSKKLKQLAVRMGCPVVGLSQLSRAVESRPNMRPILPDLRQTGQIEQDADIVVGLYRDDYYKLKRAKDEYTGGLFVEPTYDHVLEYELLKNRTGELKVARLWADPATNRMGDEPPALLDSPPLSANDRQLPPERPEGNQLNYGNNFPTNASSFDF